MPRRARLQSGTVEDQVIEEYKITHASRHAGKVKTLPTDRHARHELSGEYVTGARRSRRDPLVRAGLRQAQFLNDTFMD
jgi:hypothetical protein